MPDLPLDAYRRYLQGRLTPGRYAHSLGVMRVMGDLAPVYGLDPGRATVAGLLHDAAKDMPHPAMLDWRQKRLFLDLSLRAAAGVPARHCRRVPGATRSGGDG